MQGKNEEQNEVGSNFNSMTYYIKKYMYRGWKQIMKCYIFFRNSYLRRYPISLISTSQKGKLLY